MDTGFGLHLVLVVAIGSEQRSAKGPLHLGGAPPFMMFPPVPPAPHTQAWPHQTNCFPAPTRERSLGLRS